MRSNSRHLILAGGIAEVAVSFYLLSRPALTLVAAVLAIGLISIAHGVLQIILAFEVKNLGGHLDELAQQFDDSASARRPEAA
jgi:uncharacterized membrane protein HdeD (DUF308 family)